MNFDLLHSEFTPSQDEFEISLEPDLEYTIDFDVANGGTGTLGSKQRLGWATKILDLVWPF